MSCEMALLVCHDPQSPQWQLTRPSSTRLLVLAWKQTPAAIDAGVPSWAARVLSQALTKHNQVTFPSKAEVAEDAVASRRLLDKGLLRRLTSRGPDQFSLLTTQSPTLVEAAFEDPGFPWWLQAQLLLLSPPGAEPPELEGRELLDWVESPGTRAIRDSGKFVAELRPGVDGDVAGLISYGPETEEAFLEALQACAAAANVRVEVLSEAAFADALEG